MTASIYLMINHSMGVSQSVCDQQDTGRFEMRTDA